MNTMSITERAKKNFRGHRSLQSALSEARRSVSLADERLSPAVRQAISLPSTPIMETPRAQPREMAPRRLSIPRKTLFSELQATPPVESSPSTSVEVPSTPVPSSGTPRNLKGTDTPRSRPILKRPATPATPKSLKRVYFLDDCIPSTHFPCKPTTLDEAFYHLDSRNTSNFPVLQESAEMLKLKWELKSNHRKIADLKQQLHKMKGTQSFTPSRTPATPSKSKVKVKSPDDVKTVMKRVTELQIFEISVLKAEIAKWKRILKFTIPSRD